MIYIEDYGNLSKYIDGYPDYTEFIGKTLTIYTAGGQKFFGVLCMDTGDRIVLSAEDKRTQNTAGHAVSIFKRQISAIEMPFN